MQSFPRLPTVLLKWPRVSEVVGGGQERHLYTLVTIFDLFKYSSSMDIIGSMLEQLIPESYFQGGIQERRQSTSDF